MIKLVLSTDIPGFAHNATVLASILRRTSSPVSVRVYTRGFSYKDFEAGQLSAEFIRCDEEVSGTYPGHVNVAVFDRLRIIRDFDDWDRALVLDHDMLVFCDLAEYFEEPFDGNLLMGRMFGPGNTIGLQLSKRGGLPEGWEHCANFPYFYMGPMMNLEAMRAEGFWDRLLEAHVAIGQDEQISLTAASGGRVKGVANKWNLVPAWDRLEEAALLSCDAGPEDQIIAGVRWRGGIPEGLIHWTGPAKPWHHRSKVWRADLWDTELCGWEQLRAGNWTKPLSIEIEPEDGGRVRAMVKRGWKVRVHSSSGEDASILPKLDQHEMPWPDLSHHPVEPATADLTGADMIRFGPGSDPAAWLEAAPAMPDRIVVEGPRSVEDVEALRATGYLGEARIVRCDWPGGGPHPKVLTYSDPGEAVATGSREDLYLSRLPENQTPGVSRPSPDEAGGWEIPAELEDFIRHQLPLSIPAPTVVLEFGPGRSTEVLAETYPDAKILSVEHDPDNFRRLRHTLSALPNVEIHHAPLDPALPWYDLSKVRIPGIDLVVVDGPPGRPGSRSRGAAVSTIDFLKPGGVVILDDTDRPDEKSDREEWLKAGCEELHEADSFSVLRRPEGLRSRPLANPRSSTVELSRLAKRTYVISLPERKDRLSDLRRNWAATSMDLEFEVVDGIRPKASEILWQEMKGMEGYGKPEFLRGDYVIGAVGCKRAGIRALQTFIASGEDTALICQDDCRWVRGAPEAIRHALGQLPDDWDMVYFSASARGKHQPFSPQLMRLTGARYCTAILWKRSAAIEALPRLEDCDCELDLMMQRLHADMNAYCVVPMPAYQARSFSNIIGGFIKPPNM